MAVVAADLFINPPNIYCRPTCLQVLLLKTLKHDVMLCHNRVSVLTAVMFMSRCHDIYVPKDPSARQYRTRRRSHRGLWTTSMPNQVVPVTPNPELEDKVEKGPIHCGGTAYPAKYLKRVLKTQDKSQ